MSGIPYCHSAIMTRQHFDIYEVIIPYLVVLYAVITAVILPKTASVSGVLERFCPPTSLTFTVTC